MPRVAFLSTDNLEGYFVYDELLVAPFTRAGWLVETISWRARNVDWNFFDVVIVRSTWDYQAAPEEFIRCLEAIDRSGALLENPLNLIKWNIHKTYLRDLARQGVPVVPTVWAESFCASHAARQFDAFDTDEIIVKPVLSANAEHTYRLSLPDLSKQADFLQAQLTDRPVMIQPFLRAVVEEGEYSLFYFAQRFSHAIVKRPAPGDFRVQEEHGGQLEVCEPGPQMLQLAEKVLSSLPQSGLYARIDLIRLNGGWAIMEVELIEPSLYFQLDSLSPQKFVDAVISRYQAR